MTMDRVTGAVREICTLRSTWRGLETWNGRDAVTPRNRKGEATGNTNFDLNRQELVQ